MSEGHNKQVFPDDEPSICLGCWDSKTAQYVLWDEAVANNHKLTTEENYPYSGFKENLTEGVKVDVDKLTENARRLDGFLSRVRVKATEDPKFTAIVVLATVFLVHNFAGPIRKGLRGKRKYVTDVAFDDPYLLVKFNNKSEDKWDIMD